jgi:hypothetical protein
VQAGRRVYLAKFALQGLNVKSYRSTPSIDTISRLLQCLSPRKAAYKLPLRCTLNPQLADPNDGFRLINILINDSFLKLLVPAILNRIVMLSA